MIKATMQARYSKFARKIRPLYVEKSRYISNNLSVGTHIHNRYVLVVIVDQRMNC